MNISNSISVLDTPESVFRWIDEPDMAKLWQKGVKSGEIIKETPQKTGTIFKEILEENGKSLEMEGEITEYIPGKSISFSLRSKIHRVKVRYSVRPENEMTVVLVEASIMWKFPMNILCLFIGPVIRKKISDQTNSELMELKRLCEMH